MTISIVSPKHAVTRERPLRCSECAGSAAKLPGKESMEQLLPDLITFLLTHPHVKSMKQVSYLAVAAMTFKERQ